MGIFDESADYYIPEKISWTISALKIIGWIDFGIGVLVLLLPMFTRTEGLILFLQGIVTLLLPKHPQAYLNP